jgi:hypothetical protein
MNPNNIGKFSTNQRNGNGNENGKRRKRRKGGKRGKYRRYNISIPKKIVRTQSKKLCIYHDPCPDGAAAAVIFRQNYRGCHYIPFDHKKSNLVYEEIKKVISKVKNLKIYFLDICPLFSFVDEIKGKVKSITIIDHHKPACDKFILDKSENIIQNCKVIFDNTKSACQIVWHYFYPNKKIPDSIFHISKKDIWDFGNKYTESFCVGYPIYYEIGDPTYKERLYLFKKVIHSSRKDIQKIIQIGNSLIETYRQECTTYVEKIVFTTDSDIEGKTFKVVEIPDLKYYLNKYMIEYLQQHYPEYDVLRIKKTYDTQVSYSLRTLNKTDVSLIAQKYGGNGHKGASGYAIDK